MKKYVQNIWVRMLACILCSVSVLALGVSVVGTAFFIENPEEETVYQEGYSAIANNYALYALNNVENATNMEEFNEFFEEQGIRCKITKIADRMGEDVPLEEKSTVLYTNISENMEGNFHTTEVLKGTEYTYSVNSLWRALFGYDLYSPEDEWVKSPIIGYAYDANTGIFFYETDIGYFTIDEIEIRQNDGAYNSYELTEMDGQLCYIDAFFEGVLDSSQYENWDTIYTYTHEGYISIEEVGVVSDSLVKYSDFSSRGFKTIDFQVIGDDEAIGCYYETVLDRYQIQIGWNQEAGTDNLFAQWGNVVETLYEYQDNIFIYAVVSLAVFILAIVLLVYSAKDDTEEIGFLHKVPLFIYSGIVVLIEIMLIFLAVEGILELIYFNRIDFNISSKLLVTVAFIIVLLAFAYVQNIITRIKTRTFWRYSEFYYLIKCCRKLMKWLWSPFHKLGSSIKSGVQAIRGNIPLFWKGIVILLVISFVELLILLTCRWSPDALLVCFTVYKVIEILLILYLLFQMKILQDGAKRVASGDLSEPIDTSRMIWEFKKHGENINQVSDGIAIAVEEQMKSERFKTELITNVSHDIKTPLTSIINYVDLIKKEDITDEKLCEYIEVLDRQSARLKKLIEDLMEASKASTGNLAVNLEKCDTEVLLTQVIGEFEERLQANQLEVVVDKPVHPVMVMVDGRHMWRVLDNLLNNACKYSMPNTRVYVSLKQEGQIATLIFKNISKTALNISSEELMERFVRGDSSRNTEGNGLGLSIAQSLTELMGGTMKLDIDGDLFKVTLVFKAEV